MMNGGALLESLGVQSLGIGFEEIRVAQDKRDSCVADMQSQGYTLLGTHHDGHVLLFRGHGHYRLASFNAHETAAAAQAVVVEDTQLSLEAIHRQGLDIFDSGVIGPMSLHLPALRTPQGQFIYLIDRHQADDFYAIDFI